MPAPMDDATLEDQEQKPKRRRVLLLLTLIAIPAVALAGAVTAIGLGVAESAPSVSEQEHRSSDEKPQLQPGQLADESEAPSLGDTVGGNETREIDSDADEASSWRSGDRVDASESVADPERPLGPVSSAPDRTMTDPLERLKPIAGPRPIERDGPGPELPSGADGKPDPVIPATPTTPADPEPAPRPEPDPSTTPDPEPGPLPTTTPSPEPTPAPEPEFGGDTVADARALPAAVLLDGYMMLMHVTGNFDLSGATWVVSDGALPDGLTIDPDTGSISGITGGVLGTYRFQVRVVNGEHSVEGWFSINVVEPTEGTPTTPGGDEPDGDGSDPGTELPADGGTPGESEPDVGGSGPSTGSPQEPSPTPTPDPGETESPESPAPGDGNATPGNPDEGESGADGTDGDAGDDSDGGSDSGTTPEPAPVDPGGGETSDPEDPIEIDPGGGGSQSDVLTFDPPATIATEIGGVIDQTFAATSSLGLEITYSATGLPEWLTFTGGQLVGTAPTVEGAFNATLTASNSRNSVTRQVTITVNPGPIVVDDVSLNLSPGAEGSVELSASNGASNANFVFSVTHPGGGEVSLNGSTLTASFAAPGTYQIRVQVVDLNAPNGARTELIVPVEVAALPIIFEPEGRTVTQYVPFEVQLEAREGWGRYRFTVIEGGLPAGVTLEADGILRGAPSSTGEHFATIEVKDARGLVTQAELGIFVQENPAISPTRTIEVPSGAREVSFSAAGDRAYVSSYAGKAVSIIDVATDTVLHTITPPAATNTRLTASSSPDGRYLAINGTRTVWVYDQATMELIATLPFTSSETINDVQWSSDGARLFLSRKQSIFGYLDTISVTDWTVAQSWRYPSSVGSNFGIDLATNGHLLLTGSEKLYDYDPETMTAVSFVVIGGNAVTSAVDAGDGSLWATANGTLVRLDPATGTAIGMYHSSVTGIAIYDIVLSPDGRWIYGVGYDAVVVFDTKEGRGVASIPVTADGSSRIDVSSDGRKVYVTSGTVGTTVTVLEPVF